MFVTLLIVNFIVSFVVCLIIVTIFRTPINKILQRLVAEDIFAAWSKYITFAIYVVGVSSGVRIRELEKYITPSQFTGTQPLQLTRDRWVLEVYGTIIESLQGLAWLLLVFFVFALIAFVIVRAFELRRPKSSAEAQTA